MITLPFLCLETLPPRDILLPLPLPEWLLVALLVFSFLLHILFVNLMLGGALVAFWLEWRGRREPALDALAHEIARTVTVNKSLAVVLGVAPLLSINVLYTVFFYSANALTGRAWISVVPLVAGGVPAALPPQVQLGAAGGTQGPAPRHPGRRGADPAVRAPDLPGQHQPDALPRAAGRR